MPIHGTGHRHDLVDGVEVQLEQFDRALAVIFWIAKETPAFQLAISHAVCDRGLVLVVVFVGRFAGPFLYVLRIWLVWSVAVRDRLDMSNLALMSNCKHYSPV